jgi:hypothetical protein
MSGITGTQTEAIYTLGAAVTKNTFTSNAIITATSAAARAIVPQNFFAAVPNGIGRGLYGHMGGTVATTSAATVVITLIWNATPGTIGTTLATPWPTLAPTAATTCVWSLDFWITCQAVGAAGLTLQTNGEWKQSVVASGTLSTAPQSIMFQTNTTGLNSESQAEVALAATWSASASGNTTTINQFDLFGIC